MPTIFALRATMVACLGLGAADVVWIGASLAPRVLEPRPAAAAAVHAEPPVTASITPAPERTSAPARVSASAPVSAPALEPNDDRVYFPTASAMLGPVTRATLKRVAGRARTGATIALEGHADYRGGEGMNRHLSKQRASAVGAYLIRLGVRRAQLRIGFVGAGAPASGGELWRDRRVEIQLTRGSR